MVSFGLLDFAGEVGAEEAQGCEAVCQDVEDDLGERVGYESAVE